MPSKRIFSEDGRWRAHRADGKYHLLNTETGQRFCGQCVGRGDSISFTADSKTFIIKTDGVTRHEDISGDVPKVKATYNKIFSEDKRWYAYFENGQYRLFNTETDKFFCGQCAGGGDSISFSEDSKTFIIKTGGVTRHEDISGDVPKVKAV